MLASLEATFHMFMHACMCNSRRNCCYCVCGSENRQEIPKHKPESPEFNVQVAVKKDINGPFFF